ncbi:MAG: hypothetical protein HOV83_00095 [Catenulispora sp.]|nr:hypothetical protein [Catenulispora sp.]
MPSPDSNAAPDSNPSPDLGVDAATLRALVGRVLHDPRHLSETLATFGVQRLGSPAAARVQGMQQAHPEWSTEQYRAESVRRGTMAAISRGVLVVGPLLVLAPYGFCAALLTQNRAVLELAALAGRDPTAPERAAELLVLQDAYPNLAAARVGLTRTRQAGGTEPAPIGRLRALWEVTARTAYLLGLVSRDQEGDRRLPKWRHALQWLLIGLTFLVGLVAPLVWMPYMADSYRQSTARLTQRAERFYFGTVTAVRRTPDRSRAAAIASVLITAGLVFLVLFASVRLFDSTAIAVVVALIGGSVLGTAVGAVLVRRRLRQG